MRSSLLAVSCIAFACLASGLAHVSVAPNPAFRFLGSYQNITNDDLYAKSQQTNLFVVVDTRSADQFRAASVPGSVSMPHPNGNKYDPSIFGSRIPVVVVNKAFTYAAGVQLIQNWIDWYGLVQAYLAYQGFENYYYPVITVAAPYYVNVTAATVYKTVPNPYVIDVREPDEYAAGHVPGAYNIPLGHVEPRLFEVDVTTPVYVICRSGFRSTQATLLMTKLGLTGVNNINDGTLSWPGPLETSKDPLYRNVTTADLLKVYASSFVVDVRTIEEYASGHIPGARNIPVADIVTRISELPQDGRLVYLICGSGYRSHKATLALIAAGYTPAALRNVLGGMGAWTGPVVPTAAVAPAALPVHSAQDAQALKALYDAVRRRFMKP